MSSVKIKYPKCAWPSKERYKSSSYVKANHVIRVIILLTVSIKNSTLWPLGIHHFNLQERLLAHQRDTVQLIGFWHKEYTCLVLLSCKCEKASTVAEWILLILSVKYIRKCIFKNDTLVYGGL